MPSITRTITSALGTSPQGVAITGTITTDANSNFVLQYTGTTDLQNFTNNNGVAVGINGGNSGGQGYVFLYCAAATTKIVKVLGVNFITQSGANYQYAIQVDTALPGLSGASFQIIFANLFMYSYENTGSGNATIQGVIVPAGAGNTAPQKVRFPTIGDLYQPVYIDASLTTVYLEENSLGQ